MFKYETISVCWPNMANLRAFQRWFCNDVEYQRMTNPRHWIQWKQIKESVVEWLDCRRVYLPKSSDVDLHIYPSILLQCPNNLPCMQTLMLCFQTKNKNNKIMCYWNDMAKWWGDLLIYFTSDCVSKQAPLRNIIFTKSISFNRHASINTE